MSDLVRWLHYFNASAPTGKGRAQLCLTQSLSAHRNESLVIQSSQVQLPSLMSETQSVWAFAKRKMKYVTKWFFPAFYPPHLVSFRGKSYRKKCKEKIHRQTQMFFICTYPAAPQMKGWDYKDSSNTLQLSLLYTSYTKISRTSSWLSQFLAKQWLWVIKSVRCW